MKKIFLFCDTIIVDLVLNISKDLVNNGCEIYLQCEKIKTKYIISKFLVQNNLENKITVMCLDEYILQNFSKKFEIKDFLNFEKKYNCKLSEINISTSEFNIYHNYFKYYDSKINLDYHLSARILLIENFFEHYLKNIKIDFAFVECRNHFNTISGVLYFKKNNIPCYVLTSSIFKDYFSVNNVDTIKNPFLEKYYFSDNLVIQNYQNLIIDLEKVAKKRSTNDREKNYLNNRKKTLDQNYFEIFFNLLNYYFDFNKKTLLENFYLAKIHPIDLIKSRIMKRKKKIFYKKLISKSHNRTYDNNKKICVFFLGLSPEASTYSQCNIFFDQRKVARYVSMNLPSDYILIVKEHPSQYVSSDGRGEDYYKEILSHKNIYFANPQDKAIDLINKAEFIITSTGSVGIEAILMEKPLIMLGNNHYEIFEDILKAKDYNSLKDKINLLVNKNVKIEKEKILKFLHCYKKSFYPGNIEIFFKKKFLKKEEYNLELNKISVSFSNILNELYKLEIK